VAFELTDKQREILVANGHLLVQGGPGSGKTTVSILKAGRIVKKGLKRGQRVLFLGFARATVSRVLEAIAEEDEITSDIKGHIEVDTYHAFFWRLIKTHGYLLGLPRQLAILTPSNEAVILSDMRSGYKSDNNLTQTELDEKKLSEIEKKRHIAFKEGLVCFDLFADMAGELLHRSNKIRQLVSNAYPNIILDEFQDTAPDQWRVIRALGRESQLIALADPDQRIFDFIGADPERLQHFEEEFAPSKFDLTGENHRSKGTDLSDFGNDILKGKFLKKSYDGVYFDVFDPNHNQAVTKVISMTLQARKRLLETGPKGWSLAILVPTKRLTRIVSDAFREPLGKFPKIEHNAAVDMEAAILAAEVIAYLLQSPGGNGNESEFVNLICNYFRGKNGDSPSKTNLKEADRILAAYQKACECRKLGKSVPKRSIYLAIEATYEALNNLVLSGDPDRDWTTLRKYLDASECKRLNEIATEVRNIRLLDRGSQLRERLSQNWRDMGRYADALDIVRFAFVQEHFSTNTKPETGVVIMNMHKAKGKQFDEVIIFEGWPRFNRGVMVANPDRIVRGNKRENINDQTRQNLRVSITRAKRRTTILTPKNDLCVILTP